MTGRMRGGQKAGGCQSQLPNLSFTKKKTGMSEKGKVYVSAGVSRWEKMKLNKQQTLLHLN